MPLIPVAQAAVADPSLRAVRFAMKDGGKKITVLVSNPALEHIANGGLKWSVKGGGYYSECNKRLKG
jgi:hypothetical protein